MNGWSDGGMQRGWESEIGGSRPGTEISIYYPTNALDNIGYNTIHKTKLRTSISVISSYMT
jgi:hypothetical protein